MLNYLKIDSTDTNVSKFVFKDSDIAVEAVLYRYGSYKERTVICCSTQCGCPVGCSFCGTGKFFVRNLTADEIVSQVEMVMHHIDCHPWEIKKFQIMFMSMGEPFLNYEQLRIAIEQLNKFYPNAQLLVSSSAPQSIKKNFDNFIGLSCRIPNIGLQFSIHESTDRARQKLISKNTLHLSEIGELGERWARATERKPFFNYCVHEKNSSPQDVKNLVWYFKPVIWETTLSVICEKDQTMKNAIEQKIKLTNDFSQKLLREGYGTRVFNPAGQDDIGGGCGQLWYFQEWLKGNKK
jgi:23S rRNA (adenine2503-C2)-methyltransferase